MSLFSFGKKLKNNYSIIFNIGSGSVTSAVVRFTEKAGVDVVYYVKEPIKFQQEITPAKHLSFLKQAISSSVEKIQKKNFKGINQAFYLFSSPWSISQTKTIKIKESKPFRLTDSYLKNLVNSQVGGKDDISSQGQVIERKVTQVKVNGYVIDDLNTHLTKEAEVSIFLSVVPEKVVKTVEEATAHSFVFKNTYYHSSSLSLFTVIRDLFPNKKDFVYLDINEEMTEISIVKDGIVSDEITFPFGRNKFIRKLSETNSVPENIADSMIKVKLGDKQDKLASAQISTFLEATAAEWFVEINKALSSFLENLYMPETIFFVATNDLSHFLSDKLKTSGINVEPLTARKINSPVKIDDIMFKVSLVFLDKIYKI